MSPAVDQSAAVEHVTLECRDDACPSVYVDDDGRTRRVRWQGRARVVDAPGGMVTTIVAYGRCPDCAKPGFLA